MPWERAQPKMRSKSSVRFSPTPIDRTSSEAQRPGRSAKLAPKGQAGNSCKHLPTSMLPCEKKLLMAWLPLVKLRCRACCKAYEMRT